MANIKGLTRDQILAVNDVQIEAVAVPEWGGTIYVRGMSGTERDAFESSIVEIRGKSRKMNFENVRARLASLTVCDADGNRLFTEQDIKVLGTKSAGVLQRVFKIAQRLSGLTDDAVKELTEELEDSPLDDSASD